MISRMGYVDYFLIAVSYTHLVRICELEGYEADDLLGTAARLANERGIHAYVLTGDRDSLQLVGGETEIILTRKGITESLLLDAQGVYDTYGFTPAQIPDMKGLMGDASDNIPGIPCLLYTSRCV